MIPRPSIVPKWRGLRGLDVRGRHVVVETVATSGKAVSHNLSVSYNDVQMFFNKTCTAPQTPPHPPLDDKNYFAKIIIVRSKN